MLGETVTGNTGVPGNQGRLSGRGQAVAARLNTRRYEKKHAMPIPSRAIEVGSGTVPVTLTI
jgi:hypothetical protein